MSVQYFKQKPVRRLTFALCSALTLFNAHSASAAYFNWLDARAHPRVMLYENQPLGDHLRDHPEWFSQDFLVAGFNLSDVPYGTTDIAAQNYAFVQNQLQRSGLTIGTYVSGTTAIHETSLSHFPANVVSIEDMSVKTKYLGSWMREPDQAVIDLSDKPSRDELHRRIRLLWLHVMTAIRFVDNAAVHPRVAQLQSWEIYCQNIKELRILAATLRQITIFNVFVRPWEMTDKDIKILIDAIGPGNAISLPLPWSLAIKDDKNAQGWAIYRYRQLLDKGIVVVMIPSGDAPTGKLIKWVSTWRKSSDLIYFSTPSGSEPYWH
jgi:hypothetical protein